MYNAQQEIKENEIVIREDEISKDKDFGVSNIKMIVNIMRRKEIVKC